MAEPGEAGLERQVAVLEPGEPRPRHARRVGCLRPADARCDLLGHPVQRMDDTSPVQPAADAAEEACAPVLGVHEVGLSEPPPERRAAAEVELVPDRSGLRRDVERAEALRDRLARADHLDVHSLGRDPRGEQP